MPSPFPGMDPYLEGTEWPSIHSNLIEELARQLAPQLLPKYVVRSVRRFVMDVPITSLEIRDVAERELITAIELLSPANKRGEGYREYNEKRIRILQSRTHLLEIDLLRKGRRPPMQRPLPEAPYFVFLSRAEKRPITDVWPIQLEETLPAIPVPLLPEDDDATIDLQAALATIYDMFGYGYLIDYTRSPEIPLEGEPAVWAAERLQQAGFKRAATQP